MEATAAPDHLARLFFVRAHAGGGGGVLAPHGPDAPLTASAGRIAHGPVATRALDARHRERAATLHAGGAAGPGRRRAGADLLPPPRGAMAELAPRPPEGTRHWAGERPRI